MQLYPDWISPEAGKKLIKLLRKNKKSWNHFKKIEGVYYFNGDPFHEDGVLYFEGKITEVKIKENAILSS